MTEEEAQEKWCPMVRVQEYTGNPPIACNRKTTPSHPRGIGLDTSIHGSCFCIASECTMWRWEGPVDIWQDGTTHHPHTGDIAVGYCGLAGRPEAG